MPRIAQCQKLKLSFKLRGSLIPFYLCGNTGFAKDRASSGDIRSFSEDNIEEVPGVESVEKCQGLCNENPDCTGFTYYSDKKCELIDHLKFRGYKQVRLIITYP